MLLCYVIDSGLNTSLLLLATLIIMFYIYIYILVPPGLPSRIIEVDQTYDAHGFIFLARFSYKFSV